jgi:hypothetical protein
VEITLAQVEAAVAPFPTLVELEVPVVEEQAQAKEALAVPAAFLILVVAVVAVVLAAVVVEAVVQDWSNSSFQVTR